MSPRVALGATLLVGVWIVCAAWAAGAAALIRYGYSPLDGDVFTWWTLWRDYAHARAELLQSAGVGFALTGIPIVALCIHAAIRPRALHGAARFATRAEIRKAGLFNGDGILIARYRRRYLTLPGELFIALIAPTRSGKTIGIVVPNLLTWADSTVVLDIKGENFQITSAYRAKYGQAVYLFNPFSENTHRYNPLGVVSDDPKLRVAELLSIGYGLYPKVGRDPIWSDTARDLFVGLCLYLMETPQAPVTIGEVLRLSSSDGRPLKDLLLDIIHSRNYVKGKDGDWLPKKTAEDGELPLLSDSCVKAFGRFISAPDNTAGGILTTFSAPLTLWQSPIVDTATSDSDFDLRELRRQRISLYVVIPPNRLPEADVLLRLFFTQLVNGNTDKRPDEDATLRYQCLVLLDEAAALGYMPILAKAAGYVAGYGLRLVTILQSQGQIAKPVEDGGYGREGARSLIENHACRVMFTPKSNDDANELSEILGYETVKARSRRLYKWNDATESDQRRALMMPQELRQMSSREAIIDLEGLRPIRCQRIRYFQERTFTRRLAEVAPSLKSRRVNSKRLKAAILAGELAVPIPTLGTGPERTDYLPKATRELTCADIDSGIDLDALDVDIDSLPQHDEPMSDAQVSAFVSSFCEVVGITNEATAQVTSEVRSEAFDIQFEQQADLVDLSPLRA